MQDTTLKNNKYDFKDGVCIYCNKDAEEGTDCGKLLTDKDRTLSVHNYCLLFASGLSQQGEDDEGIDGFLIPDILAEYRRGKKLRCFYCSKKTATIGCSRATCRRCFHFNCGFQHEAMFLFFDTFLAYCKDHRPQQVVSNTEPTPSPVTCPICMDEVEAKVSNQTLKTPCCNNTWFHRSCVQHQALSAGYFFRCAICNNQDKFQEEMKQFGIYIPEHDASWEKEANAFQELYWRHDMCDIDPCKCPEGRKFNKASSKWELVLCDLCGSSGCHLACGGLKSVNQDWACAMCSAMLSNATEVSCPSAGSPQRSPPSVVESPTKTGQTTRTAMKLMGKHPRAPLSTQTSRKKTSFPSPLSSSQNPNATGDIFNCNMHDFCCSMYDSPSCDSPDDCCFEPPDLNSPFEHCKPSTSREGLEEANGMHKKGKKRKLSFCSKENALGHSPNLVENATFKKHCTWKTQSADMQNCRRNTSSGLIYGPRTTLRFSMRPRNISRSKHSPFSEPMKRVQTQTTKCSSQCICRQETPCKAAKNFSTVPCKTEADLSPSSLKQAVGSAGRDAMALVGIKNATVSRPPDETPSSDWMTPAKYPYATVTRPPDEEPLLDLSTFPSSDVVKRMLGEVSKSRASSPVIGDPSYGQCSSKRQSTDTPNEGTLPSSAQQHINSPITFSVAEETRNDPTDRSCSETQLQFSPCLPTDTSDSHDSPNSRSECSEETDLPAVSLKQEVDGDSHDILGQIKHSVQQLQSVTSTPPLKKKQHSKKAPNKGKESRNSNHICKYLGFGQSCAQHHCERESAGAPDVSKPQSPTLNVDNPSLGEADENSPFRRPYDEDQVHPSKQSLSGLPTDTSVEFPGDLSGCSDDYLFHYIKGGDDDPGYECVSPTRTEGSSEAAYKGPATKMGQDEASGEIENNVSILPPDVTCESVKTPQRQSPYHPATSCPSPWPSPTAAIHTIAEVHGSVSDEDSIGQKDPQLLLSLLQQSKELSAHPTLDSVQNESTLTKSPASMQLDEDMAPIHDLDGTQSPAKPLAPLCLDEDETITSDSDETQISPKPQAGVEHNKDITCTSDSDGTQLPVKSAAPMERNEDVAHSCDLEDAQSSATKTNDACCTEEHSGTKIARSNTVPRKHKKKQYVYPAVGCRRKFSKARSNGRPPKVVQKGVDGSVDSTQNAVGENGGGPHLYGPPQYLADTHQHDEKSSGILLVSDRESIIDQESDLPADQSNRCEDTPSHQTLDDVQEDSTLTEEVPSVRHHEDKNHICGLHDAQPSVNKPEKTSSVKEDQLNVMDTNDSDVRSTVVHFSENLSDIRASKSAGKSKKKAKQPLSYPAFGQRKKMSKSRVKARAIPKTAEEAVGPKGVPPHRRNSTGSCQINDHSRHDANKTPVDQDSARLSTRMHLRRRQPGKDCMQDAVVQEDATLDENRKSLRRQPSQSPIKEDLNQEPMSRDGGSENEVIDANASDDETRPISQKLGGVETGERESEIEQSPDPHQDERPSQTCSVSTGWGADTALADQDRTKQLTEKLLRRRHEKSSAPDFVLQEDTGSNGEQSRSESERSESSTPYRLSQESVSVSNISSEVVETDLVHERMSVSPLPGREAKGGLKTERPSSTTLVWSTEVSPDSGISQGYNCSREESSPESASPIVKEEIHSCTMQKDVLVPKESTSSYQENLMAGVHMMLENEKYQETDSDVVCLGTTYDTQATNDADKDMVLKPAEFESVKADGDSERSNATSECTATLSSISSINSEMSSKSSAPKSRHSPKTATTTFKYMTRSSRRRRISTSDAQVSSSPHEISPSHNSSKSSCTVSQMPGTPPIKPAEVKPSLTFNVGKRHRSPEVFHKSAERHSCPGKSQANRDDEESFIKSHRELSARYMQILYSRVRTDLFRAQEQSTPPVKRPRTESLTRPDPSFLLSRNQSTRDKSNQLNLLKTRLLGDSVESKALQTPKKAKPESPVQKSVCEDDKSHVSQDSRSTISPKVESQGFSPSRPWVLRSSSTKQEDIPFADLASTVPSPCRNKASSGSPRTEILTAPDSTGSSGKNQSVGVHDRARIYRSKATKTKVLKDPAVTQSPKSQKESVSRSPINKNPEGEENPSQQSLDSSSSDSPKVKSEQDVSSSKPWLLRSCSKSRKDLLAERSTSALPLSGIVHTSPGNTGNEVSMKANSATPSQNNQSVRSQDHPRISQSKSPKNKSKGSTESKSRQTRKETVLESPNNTKLVCEDSASQHNLDSCPFDSLEVKSQEDISSSRHRVLRSHSRSGKDIFSGKLTSTLHSPGCSKASPGQTRSQIPTKLHLSSPSRNNESISGQTNSSVDLSCSPKPSPLKDLAESKSPDSRQTPSETVAEPICEFSPSQQNPNSILFDSPRAKSQEDISSLRPWLLRSHSKSHKDLPTSESASAMPLPGSNKAEISTRQNPTAQSRNNPSIKDRDKTKVHQSLKPKSSKNPGKSKSQKTLKEFFSRSPPNHRPLCGGGESRQSTESCSAIPPKMISGVDGDLSSRLPHSNSSKSLSPLPSPASNARPGSPRIYRSLPPKPTRMHQHSLLDRGAASVLAKENGPDGPIFHHLNSWTNSPSHINKTSPSIPGSWPRRSCSSSSSSSKCTTGPPASVRKEAREHRKTKGRVKLFMDY